MDSDFNFFKIEYNNVLPKPGKVLISEPFLLDSFFKRSVILLTEHNKKGTVGFILNKPVDISVNEVLTDFPEFNARASIGGPVGTNTVHYLHTLGDTIPNSVNVFDSIYWGGDFEQIKLLIDSGIIKSDQIRFFIGYSGWEPKQLDREISENSWLVSDIEQSDIFSTGDQDVWKTTLNKLEDKYKMWTKFPENPGLN